MTKKRLLLIAAVPLVVAVTLGVLAILPPRPDEMKTKFDRIQDGMTMAEVEQIFGEKGVFVGRGRAIVFWKADDGSAAFVEFREDCVTGKEWADSKETILDKIRRWLHLP
jgi:hypothetical protein